MTTHKEALMLALEALELHGKQYPHMVKGYCLDAIAAIKEALAQPEQEPEFVTHNVDKPYDWSEWVCPNPSGYLMKCCDCGLVHEAEFGVVRYKSETEREDCDMVDDPNLQAVFRMRRSEKWSPEDTAHRAGGLPMAQPEQEPVAWGVIASNTGKMCQVELDYDEVSDINSKWLVPLYTTPPQRKPLTDEEIEAIAEEFGVGGWICAFARAIEAVLKEKNDC